MHLRDVTKPDEADASRSNVAALCDEACGPSDVMRFNVPYACVDVEAVARRDGDFIMHVKLRVPSASARLR